MHRIAWPDRPASNEFPYGNVLDMNEAHQAIFIRREDGKILWSLGKVVPDRNDVVMLSHGVVLEGLPKASLHSVSIDDFGIVILFYSEKSDRQPGSYIVGRVERDRRITWNRPERLDAEAMAGEIRSTRRTGMVAAVWSGHMTAMSSIKARVGELDRGELAIHWGIANEVEGGGFPTLAINDLNRLVQVHETDFLLSHRWYCRGGTIDPQSHHILWRESEKIGKALNYYGRHPIGMLSNGLVLEMHAQTNLGPTIWYRFGAVDDVGDVSWETEEWIDGGPGGFIAFAINNSGTVLANRGARLPFNPDSLWVGKITGS